MFLIWNEHSNRQSSDKLPKVEIAKRDYLDNPRTNTDLNIKEYIESGVLELFAMGQLSETEKVEVITYLGIYDELREELERIETAMEQYAIQHSIKPPNYVRAQVIDTIANFQKEQEMDPADLPLINKYSDYKNWIKFVANFDDLPLGKNGRHTRVLRKDDEVTQVLIISTTNIEQEVHQIEHESFLILSGECKCTIGDQVSLMKAGDFMRIPLFEPHDVQLISPQVTAILQRVSI